MEDDDVTKNLMDSLITVRQASIARWNEHKDVKEDKERDPCIFVPHIKTENVDTSLSRCVVTDLHTAAMLNLALKSFKRELP